MSSNRYSAAGRRLIRLRQQQTVTNARPQTISPSVNFSAPQSFNFGASAPAPSSDSNGINFGASNPFGGATTNSFPPAQSAAPSNSFVNSSFPAFGASSQGTSFNPQPPSTNFNFTAGSSNPFAQSNGATPASSAPSTSAFGGSSIFSSQAPSNPFGGLTSNNNNNTTTAASSGSMFGTSGSAPTANMFGATNANATPNPTSASTPFSFGNASSTTQNTTNTPATSSMFGGFGTTQTSAPPATNSIFSGFGSNAPKNDAAPATTQSGIFGAGTSAQGTANATATAPATGLFNFGAVAQKKEAAAPATPSTSLFGAPQPAVTASTAASNPFSALPAATGATPLPAFSFGQQSQSTPQTQEKAPSNPFGNIKLPEQNANTPKPSLFSSVKPAQESAPTPAPAATESSKPNLFASLAKPSPAASTPPSFSFGSSSNKDTTSEANEKPSPFAPSKVTEPPKPSLFSGFNTPQPAKTTQVEKSQPGLFSAQPKTNSGVFSQTFQPENSNAAYNFKAPSTFSAFKSQATSSAPSAPKEPEAQPTITKDTSKELSNPFANSQTPSADRPNLFAPPQQQASTPAPSPMPTLTGATSPATGTTNQPEVPKIGKLMVPKEWDASAAIGYPDTNRLSEMQKLAIQLRTINEAYLEKLKTQATLADWSALSLWHSQTSSAIKKKFDLVKKQRAAEKGVTGNESTLSTKRKVDESPEDRNASPTKRARPIDPSASPTPQPSAPTPTLNPPASATSSLFAKAISKPSAPSEASNLFAPKSTEKPATESSKPPAAITGFKPSASASNGTSSSSPFSGGFKPSASTSSSNVSGGFKPTVTGGGFASQFAAKAKTYEELAAERKKKAKDADYDSDDETEEEWSARYDKEEAERLAKEKAEAAAVSGFSLAGPAKTSGASTAASNPFSALTKPANSSSTTANGLFTPRPASPALSTGSQSVFDAPSTTGAASPNIFGHLSSGPSSNNQDDSDDDERPVGSVEPTTPPKRKLGDSETEADVEEVAKRAKPNSPKGSLLSRMTRDDGSGSEKENGNSGSIFGQTNGTSTPANKPFSFFNFEAAGAKTAPPKSDTFGGDQTFKPGTPIKFGEAPATEKQGEKAPTFQFQPASTSTTPSKPPPTNLFNFGSATGNSSLLTPAANLSGLNSAPSSVFSSRAATPLSEAETSAQSAAEDEEEGSKQEQVDLSKLTAEELAANEIVFETEAALAKHQVDKGDGNKTWENFARGPLWILKDKVTGKCFVRIRIGSGATPLNYSILPALKSTVTGSSGKMVQATMPKKEGGFAPVYISVKTPEIAKEFSTKYNASLPS